MNQTQRNYAIKRVNELLNNKLEGVQKKHSIPGHDVTLEDVLDAIKKGKAKLKSAKAIREEGRLRYGGPRNLELREVYRNLPENKARSFNKEAFEKEAQPLRDKAKDVIDEIMLGDEATAMKLLKDFEKELSKK